MTHVFTHVTCLVAIAGTINADSKKKKKKSITLPTTVRISQMPPLSAQPLKVAISTGSSKGDQGSRTPVGSRGSSPGPSRPLANPADISSPHELTAFVRCILRTHLPNSFLPPIAWLKGILSPPVLFVRLDFQVEALLEQLDTKFDDMSSQIIDRSAWSPSPFPSGVSLVVHK